jgi:peptidyl-prolyl cis-trans isomerase A (cyclophilin A)
MRVDPRVALALPWLATVMALAQTPVPTVTPPREPGLYVRLETTLGTITARLFEAEAPVTVRSFVSLAEGKKLFKDPKTGQMVRRPFYDGVAIHRVIPGFMVQMGDPTGTGAYDPGFTVPDEFNAALKFDRPGRLGMANTGDKNSGNCQFFITEAPAPHLNNLHTVFGQVIEGQDVVQKIGSAPRDANDKPRGAVVIKRVVVERSGSAPAAPKKQ